MLFRSRVLETARPGQQTVIWSQNNHCITTAQYFHLYCFGSAFVIAEPTIQTYSCLLNIPSYKLVQFLIPILHSRITNSSLNMYSINSKTKFHGLSLLQCMP